MSDEFLTVEGPQSQTGDSAEPVATPPPPPDSAEFTGPPPAQIGLPQPVADKNNPYLESIRQERDIGQQLLKSNLYNSQVSPPDRRAEALDLSKKTGLSVDLIERNFDEVKKRSAIQSIDPSSLSEKNPNLSDWLTQSPDNAVLAWDDIPALSRVDTGATLLARQSSKPEDNAYSADEAFETGWNELKAGSYLMAAAYGVMTPEEAGKAVAASNKRAQELRARFPDFAKEFEIAMEKEGGDVDRAAHRLTDSFKEISKGEILKFLSEFAKGGIQTVGETIDMIGAMAIRPRGFLHSTIQQIPNSVAPMALSFGLGAGGFAAGGPVLGVAGMVAGSFLGQLPAEIGSTMNELLAKKGYDTTNPDDMTRALSDASLMKDIRQAGERKGVTTAGIDSLITGLAGKFLGKALHETRGLSPAQRVGRIIKAEGIEFTVGGLGEGVSEVGGQVAQYKGDLSQVSVAEGVKEMMMSMHQTAGESVIGASARGAFHNDTVEAAKELALKTRDALQTMKSIETLAETAQAVRDAKLTERSPEKVAEVIETAHPGGAVYFQPEDWKNYWMQRGVSPAQAADDIMGDGGKAYHDATSHGTDLRIALGPFLARLAPTEHMSPLLSMLRTDENGQTLPEAHEHLKNLPATLGELAKEGLPAEETVTTTPSESEIVGHPALRMAAAYDDPATLSQIVKTKEGAETLIHALAERRQRAIERIAHVGEANSSTRDTTQIGDTNRAMRHLMKLRETLPAAADAATPEQSARAVGEQVGRELKAAGGQKKAAIVTEAFWRTMGQEFGVSPEKLYRETLPLSVQKIGEETAAQADEIASFDQAKIIQLFKNAKQTKDAPPGWKIVHESDGTFSAIDINGDKAVVGESRDWVVKQAHAKSDHRNAKEATRHAPRANIESGIGKAFVDWALGKHGDAFFSMSDAEVLAAGEQFKKEWSAKRPADVVPLFGERDGRFVARQGEGEGGPTFEIWDSVDHEYVDDGGYHTIEEAQAAANEMNRPVAKAAGPMAHAKKIERAVKSLNQLIGALERKYPRDGGGPLTFEVQYNRVDPQGVIVIPGFRNFVEAVNHSLDNPASLARITISDKQWLSRLNMQERGDINRAIDTAKALFENAPRTFEQAATVSPLGFYSFLEDTVQKIDFKSMPAKDLAGRIKNMPGIKADELEETGFLDFLKLVEEAKGTPPIPTGFVVVDPNLPGADVGPTFESREEAQAWLNDQVDADFDEIREVKDTIPRDGKVTKEQAVAYLQKHGVQIQQTVLAEDESSRDRSDENLPTVADLEWDEGEVQDATEEDIRQEVENNMEDKDWLKEERAALRDGYVDDFTDKDTGEVDEEKLTEKLDQVIEEQQWEVQSEYISSGDSYYSQKKYTEEKTGWTLTGNDERGWYSDDADKYFEGSLEEVKIKLTRFMAREGVIDDNAPSVASKDVEWKSPEAVVPTEDYIVTSKEGERLYSAKTKKDAEAVRQNRLDATYRADEEKAKWASATIEKSTEKTDATITSFRHHGPDLPQIYQDRANALVESDRERLKAEVIASEAWWLTDEDYTKDPAKLEEKFKEEIQAQAEKEVAEKLVDPANMADQDVQVVVDLDHPLLKGKLIGANDGWRLALTKAPGGVRNIIDEDLGPGTLDEAKAKALSLLQQKGIATGTPTQAAVETPAGETPPNPNIVTGRAKWVEHRIEGGKNYREFLLVIDLPEGRGEFESGHFRGYKNILAHIRVTERVDADGKRTLLIEELQSDWMQLGREYGFQGIGDEERAKELQAAQDAFTESVNALVEFDKQALERHAAELPDLNELRALGAGPRANEALAGVMTGDETRERKRLSEISHAASRELEQLRDVDAPVARPPFRPTDSWATLSMKRMLRVAVEEGFDAIAWTPAEVQTQRWGTEHIGWKKVEQKAFVVVDEKGNVEAEHDTREAATAEIERLEAHGKALHKELHDAGKALEKAQKESEALQKKINAAQDSAALVAEAYAEGGPRDRHRDAADKQRMARRNWESYHEGGKLSVEAGTTHWLIGDVRGGALVEKELDDPEAQKARIAADLPRRNKMLEERGTRVTTERQAFDAIKKLVSRDTGQRSMKSIAKKTWELMQTQDEGLKQPRKEGFEFFYNQMIGKVTSALLKKLDKGAKVEAGHIGEDFTETEDKAAVGQKIWEVVLTPALKDNVKKGFPLFQDPITGQPRGRIRILDDKAVIEMGQHDPSTFFHENGHYFLESLARLAARADAPEKVKAHYQGVIDFAKKKADHMLGESLDGLIAQAATPERKAALTQLREDINARGGADYIRAIADSLNTATDPVALQTGVLIHEYVARSFEAYIMEGNAPSLSLKGAFNRFKVWLLSVYKRAQSLNVELTPEVRRIFDQLLATDEEITQAQRIMGTEQVHPSVMGLTGKEGERFANARDQARIAASEKIEKKLRDEARRENTKAWKEKRKEVEADVMQEANTQPVYRAIAALRFGTHPDGTPLAEGARNLKLSRKAVEALIGKDIARRIPRGLTTNNTETGIHPDEVAHGFGFASGTEMLTQMIAAEPREALIKRLTDQRMKAIHGDLLTDPVKLPEEALKALHSAKHALRLRMELEHMAIHNLAALKDSVKKLASRVPTERQVREQAQAILQGTRLSDLKPTLFLRAENKARKEAADLWTKGDFDGAFDAKRRELLNAERFRAVSEAKDKLEKDIGFFRRVFRKDKAISRSRDTNFVNAARAILAHIGLGRGTETVGGAMSHLETLRKYDPDSYEVMKSLVDAALEVPAGSYSQMTFEQWQRVSDAVHALWDLAGVSQQMTIEGRTMERRKASEALRARLSDLGAKSAQYTKDSTKWEGMIVGLMGMRAALRRVESWVDAMDHGDPEGPFRKFIWAPVENGILDYRAAKHALTPRIIEILKPLKERMRDTTPIVSQELGYTFTRSSLLGAIFHSGNTSNLSKLLRGYGWGSLNDDGTLDRTKWDAFIKRAQKEGILTKQDYDAVQALWDLFEQLKPISQSTHKRLYGHYFDEVSADPITTPFGVYRGGYAPAMADPRRVADAATNLDKEALSQSGNSFMFPSTGKGFTKTRVQQYAAPLLMDLRLAPMALDKQLKFIHIMPAVKQVATLLMFDKDLKAALDSFDPGIVGDMLTPWLQRSAQQTVSKRAESKGGRALDYVASRLRENTGLQLMAINVINTVQNAGGLTLALTKVSTLGLTKHLFRDALWNYMRSPADVVKTISAKSKVMAERMTTAHFEMSQELHNIIAPSRYEGIKNWFKSHGYFLQTGLQNVMDIAVWSASYNEALGRGETEEASVTKADSDVKLTQGSFSPENVSAFEAQRPIFRVLSMFYSYFNMQANLMGTEFVKTTREMGLKRGTPKLLYAFTVGFLIPNLINELFIKILGGGLDENDDDKYMDDFLEAFFMGNLRGTTAMVPIAGPIALSGINVWNDKPYDDRITLSPAIGMLEKVARVGAGKSFEDLLSGNTKRGLTDLLSTLGLMTGLPVGPLGRPVGYALDVESGKAQPQNALDYARGLMTGKAGGKRK